MENCKVKNVTIVLLNYNGYKDTIACYESIQNIIYTEYNIVIVDNDSSDNSIDNMIQYMKEKGTNFSFFESPEIAMANVEKKLKISLIQSGYNGGYGHGNNIGIKYALKNGADYILILNNDTVVASNFLQPLVELCEYDNNVGIASGQIFYFDRPDTFWFNGGSFDKCTGKVKHINYDAKNTGQKPLENSTFITGCVWLIPRRIFETVGFINEEYFMYVEDLEFSQRVLDKGYSLKVSETSRIWHKVGSSSGGELTQFSIYWRTRNWLLFMKNNMEPKYWILGFYNGIVKLAITALINMKFELLSKQYKAVSDVLKIKRN